MCFGKRYLTSATADTQTFENLTAASTTNDIQDLGVRGFCVSAALALCCTETLSLDLGFLKSLCEFIPAFPLVVSLSV